jgi:hypothetical protein
VNVVPLETLNWLPREGDLILLPGEGVDAEILPAAYLVDSIEHFYAPATHKRRRVQEARLTKVVCAVTTLNPTFTNMDLTGEAIKDEPKGCREQEITDITG